MPERQGYNLEIIAGPCSIDHENIREIYEIADIRSNKQPAIFGTRTVGVKSRTENDPTGNGMGIDYPVIFARPFNPHIVPPSVEYAEQIVADTQMLVATEVIVPGRQLPHFVGRIPEGKLLAWNPSVDQLGGSMYELAEIAQDNGWDIGIKNGKALGTTLEEANDPKHPGTPMEKTWLGLETWARGGTGRTIFIQRGVDIPEKGNYRNAPVHEAARRVKRKAPGSLMFFDPSHTHGPKLRDSIVEGTIHAMHMKDGNSFLYDGILVEAGTSSTDTDQHISVAELEDMVKELGTFRILRAPEYHSAHSFYQYTGRKEKVEAVAD